MVHADVRAIGHAAEADFSTQAAEQYNTRVPNLIAFDSGTHVPHFAQFTKGPFTASAGSPISFFC